MKKVDAIVNYRCPLCSEQGTLEHFKVIDSLTKANNVSKVRCSNCTYEVDFSDFMQHTLLTAILYEVRGDR